MQGNIVPLHNWIVIEVDEVKQTAGGIFIPEGADEDPSFMSKTGTVVAVGTGVLCESGEVVRCESVVGERVEFLTPAAKRVKINGKLHYLVRDGNVMFRYLEGE